MIGETEGGTNGKIESMKGRYAMHGIYGPVLESDNSYLKDLPK